MTVAVTVLVAYTLLPVSGGLVFLSVAPTFTQSVASELECREVCVMAPELSPASEVPRPAGGEFRARITHRPPRGRSGRRSTIRLPDLCRSGNGLEMLAELCAGGSSWHHRLGASSILSPRVVLNAVSGDGGEGGRCAGGAGLSL